jgi:hypothetical protein
VTQQFQPVHSRTAHARDDDFTALLGGGECRVAGQANLGFVALVVERLGQETCRGLVVIDDQDSRPVGL